jgi:hypothetical protein
VQKTLEQVVSKTTGPGVYQYIRKYTPLGGGGEQPMSFGGKKENGKEKKGKL